MNGADKIFRLFRTYGESDNIYEHVSQTEHMVQAAMLAEQEGGSDEEVLAALLHDVGHLVAINNVKNKMGGLGQMGHEKIGATYLRELGFPERVCQLVLYYVQAKRYLVGKHKKYYDELSEASKGTLKYQGGPMNVQELEQFEKDPLFESALKLRSWDDQAKVPGKKIKELEEYREIILRSIG